MTEPFVDDRGMNGTVFLAYLEQVLVPTLKSGDIVNMDNLPPTSRRRCVERTRRLNAVLPAAVQPRHERIEDAFAKMKAMLRAKVERLIGAGT